MLLKIVGLLIDIIKKIKRKQQRRIIQTIESCLCRYYEKRLGIDTLGFIEPEEKQSFFKDELAYEAVPYIIIRKTFQYLRPGRGDVIIDVGCGKGRIICFAAFERRIKRVIGIELYRNLYEMAVDNINNLKVKKTKIDIFHADAIDFVDIDDVTIFIIFNPFWEKTLTKVINNIEKSIKFKPRTIYVAYFPTPNLARLFNETSWLFFKKRLKVFALSPIYIYSNQKD